MGLTRPRFEQINSIITTISDPITVLNQGATLANIDVGFIINRNSGTLANTAIFWNESANTFVTAFTTTTGAADANISISEYANLRVGTLTATFVNATGNISTAQLNAEQINTTGNVSAVELIGRNLTTRSTYGNINLTQYNSIFADGSGSQNIVAIQLSTTGLSDGMGMLGTTSLPSTLYSTRGIVFRTGVTVRNTDTPTGGVSLVRITATGELFANSTTPSTSTSTGALVVTGGVGVGGNIISGGNIVSGGNVTAPYFFGNGSQLSGVITSVTKIINGTSDVTAYSGSNIAVTVGGTANTILFTNSITSTSNVTGALRVTGLGGIGVGGNVYVGQRVGFVWGANNVSSVYQVFNNSTNSLDTVFG